MSKFRVGDKVQLADSCPHSHSFDGTGIVTKDDGSGWLQYRVNKTSEVYGDRCLELVTESNQGEKVMRKTYKLVRDMPGYKKGTLFQEQCEDGTQPYSVLEQPGVDPYHEVRLEFRNRSYVEENPKWFVEVFQVEPQYMTREELDQWEAFKKFKRLNNTRKYHLGVDYAKTGADSSVVFRPKRKYVKSGKYVKKAA